MKTPLVLRISVLVFVLLGGLPLGALAEAPSAETVLATYSVRSGVLEGRPTQDQKALWTLVTRMVPPTLINLIDTLEFFESSQAEDQASTDGYATLNTDTTFTLGLNFAEAQVSLLDRDPDHLPGFQQTIWHEFGHILGFQASQRDLSGTVTGTLEVDEGILQPDSYLNRYYEKFWKKTYPDRGSQTLSDKEGAALYATAPDSFVTEYAATGPLEDFAESFSFFIVDPLPTGNALKDQKVKFFATWPELVALRTQAQTALRMR